MILIVTKTKPKSYKDVTAELIYSHCELIHGHGWRHLANIYSIYNVLTTTPGGGHRGKQDKTSLLPAQTETCSRFYVSTSAIKKQIPKAER